MLIGALFGLALIAVGEVAHSRTGTDSDKGLNSISAALSGSGFVTLFAVTLLSYGYYHILPPGWAYLLLTLISLSASVMAIRLGPLLAVLGIIGGLIICLASILSEILSKVFESMNNILG